MFVNMLLFMTYILYILSIVILYDFAGEITESIFEDFDYTVLLRYMQYTQHGSDYMQHLCC